VPSIPSNLTTDFKGFKRFVLLRVLILFLLAHSAFAYDLSGVRVSHLQNGLTVMVLEDHTQPLISTQALYNVGARNECVGATGLAHFLEHMAFRATKNFEDTQDAIYSVGGEWHGYTWIDQTTYFETVPVESFDTVLRLQADRMANVLNRAEEVEAERGAVLTELHSYENDPASVLFDQVLALSFLQHSYRYNTIGWVSDVERITHSDLVNFYERYYTPANAVLAIAGDVDAEKALTIADRYFGAIPRREVDSLPRTIEPPQNGERRLTLNGSGRVHYYQITYRAPAAKEPDYAAFLLLQAVLGGSNGVSFRQSGFSEDVRFGTRLSGIGRKISTFFTATAQPYVFNIAGQAETDPTGVETEIEKRLSSVRDSGVQQDELDRARKALLAELVFDIETTEDAAHQMAFFEGIGAFAVLQQLPELLNAVTADQVQAMAKKYLRPEQRTIGWVIAKPTSEAVNKTSRPVGRASAPAASPLTNRVAGRDAHPPNSALVRARKDGPALIVQQLDRTPAGYLRILIPSNTIEANADYSANQPVWGTTSLHWRFLKGDLVSTIGAARKALDSIKTTPAVDPETIDDPETRLGLLLEEMIGVRRAGTPSPEISVPARPYVIALSGDVNPEEAMKLLTSEFVLPKGKLTPADLKIDKKSKKVRIPGKAQSQYGYAVIAPAPSHPDSFAYRLLLYIMTHGYGGRLGKELIHSRGLIYYIGNEYHSDGTASWISIRYGVNPDKLSATGAEFEKLMQALHENPPTAAELDEAKRHLTGRRITAHQSNEELTAFYAREYVEQGRILTQQEFATKINAVTLKDLQRIIPDFLSGVTAIVDTNKQ